METDSIIDTVDTCAADIAQTLRYVNSFGTPRKVNVVLISGRGTGIAGLGLIVPARPWRSNAGPISE